MTFVCNPVCHSIGYYQRSPKQLQCTSVIQSNCCDLKLLQPEKKCEHTSLYPHEHSK